MRPVRFADVVEGLDVRVAERSHRAGLTVESSQSRGIVRHVSRQDLDRDVSAKPRVAGAVDLAHPARADEIDDLVWPQARSPRDRQLMRRRARRGPLHQPLGVLLMRQ